MTLRPADVLHWSRIDFSKIKANSDVAKDAPIATCLAPNAVVKWDQVCGLDAKEKIKNQK